MAVRRSDRHRIDAIGADELQMLRDACRAAFAATMASHSGRTRLSLVNTKMSSWKMMVRTRGCAATMRSIICMHFVGIEPRDRRDAALRLVQEIGGGAERAAHRAIVERDQAHRADLGKLRFARRLGRQGADAIRGFEPLPVRLVRHVFVGRAEDRVAQLVAIERGLRQAQHRAVCAALGGPADAAQWLPCAQTLAHLAAAAARLRPAPRGRTARART